MLELKNYRIHLSVLQRVCNFISLATEDKNQSELEDKAAQPYRNDTWVLSERDSKTLLDAMEHPPAPSKALLSVFE